ncbi:hypothetical protein V493_00090 [Pseudogymnoascus sp. VKM F-4281 (FW-2241)]|nr:hypothetical protein V493_00090 [Pseudogymnoascus sp. VKM F-4281 (FW-2241)]
MLIAITAMSHSQANLQPPGLRKRKPTITVTDEELQRQKHSKMTAGDRAERIDLTAMAEPTANPTIMEPDSEDDKIIADPKIEDMFAKMKLEREIKTEKLTREGRRVMKEILISERCTSCGVRILHMGRCDYCSMCTPCGQQLSPDGKCQVCAKLRCEEWRDNVDQSPIPESALKSRAMDVPTHQHYQINPNDELEKHQSRPDAVNSKPEGEKAEVDELECAASSLLTMPATEEPENEHAVAMWKSVAISLLTMQSFQLMLDDDSESDIWKLAAGYMLEIQPSHESEGTLPGIDFITIQNEKRGLNGIIWKIAAWYKSALPGLNFITTQIEGRGLGATKVVPLQQMERLLSGIPDAQIVAFFILCHLPEEHHALLSCTTIFVKEHTPIWRGHVHLPEEHHALLSCTTIFVKEHTPIWRGHVLFEEWSEEENVAFACEFSRLVPESSATIFVLQKWHRLLAVN